MKNLCVKPFNDLYFKFCSYNSLFACVIYHMKSIIPIMVSSVPLYHFDIGNEVVLSIEYTESNLNNILNTIQLELVYFNDDDLISFIKKSVDLEYPVILDIDRFYIPFHKNVFHKQHKYHTIVVCGYAQESDELFVLDQKYADTLTYTEFTIKSSELIYAYEGYIQGNGKVYGEGISSLQKKIGKRNFEKADIYLNTYISNYITNNCFDNRIDCLSKVLNCLDEIVYEWNFNKFKCDNIIKTLNDIVNHKRVEHYLFNCFDVEDSGLKETIKKTETLYSNIRSMIIKRQLTNTIFDEQLTKDIYNIFKDIYNYELESKMLFEKIVCIS